ncbi:MAG: CotH kinase family protein [Bdellovibrionales bacterium]|nr:CotH kinase family protein [Bdellovibrionales bacterium]
MKMISKTLTASLQLTLTLGVSHFATTAVAAETPTYRAFAITLSPADLQRAGLNEKMKDAAGQVEITGGKRAKAKVETRGQSSIRAPRKNFSIELENCKPKTPVPGYEIEGEGVCKFILTSMWQDRGYVSTKIGLEFMRTFNVSEAKSEYVELFLNGRSRGLYLMSEDPKHIVKKELDAVWIGKRKGTIDLAELKKGKYDGFGQLEEVYVDKNIKCKECGKNQFMYIRDLFAASLAGKISGKKLAVELAKTVDLDQMMTFMAINRWLRNGDYSDEFLLYQKNSNEPFRIFGWDYDDLFKNIHFLSYNPARIFFHDSLNYSSEATIFLLFAKDSYLKALYHQKLYQILTTDAEGKVNAIMNTVLAGLSPYASLKNVEVAAREDDRKINKGAAYTKEYLAKNWEARKNEILEERLVILEKLEKEGFGKNQ